MIVNHDANLIERHRRPWLWKKRRWSDHDNAAYRRIALQLNYDLPKESAARSVLVTTPAPCPFSAAGGVGLASSLEKELGRPVLLIDACPARQDVSRMLTGAEMEGWTDLLREPTRSLESLVLRTSAEHLRFLPAGTTRHEAAGSEGVEARLKTATAIYDFVLAFGGSVLNDASSLALLPHVGCVLLFVAENETRIEDLEAAQEALALCKARNVRVVLTSPHRGKADLTSHTESQRESRPRAIPRLVPE